MGAHESTSYFDARERAIARARTRLLEAILADGCGPDRELIDWPGPVARRPTTEHGLRRTALAG